MNPNELTVFISLADQLKIESDHDYIRAGEMWESGKAAIKAIDEQHADDIDFAHKEHKRLIAERDKVKKPVEEATARIKRMMAEWKQEQERKAREEARRLEAEARKREEERKLLEAIEAEEAGDKAGADAIMLEPIMVPPASIPSTPKVSVVFQERWFFEIENESLIPRDYLIPNETKIGQVVRASKGTIAIPGVRAYSRKV